MSAAVPQTGQGDPDVSGGAELRSELYRTLAASFRFPSREFFEAVASGEFQAAFLRLLRAAPFQVPHLELTLHPFAGLDGDLDKLCSEYIRLFEVGNERSKPPCPLYGGEYAVRPRLDVMEELVRFYGYFDLALSDSDRELPDHISVELEFLHYLAFRESHSLDSGGDYHSLRRAQADFIERHPASWIPRMRERLEAHRAPAFFLGLVALTAAILNADLGYLRSIETSEAN